MTGTLPIEKYIILLDKMYRCFILTGYIARVRLRLGEAREIGSNAALS
jgi:hypothetical protein